MYRDVLLKIIFYKERAMQELIKKGIPPTNPNIEDKLKNINMFLSLYEHENVMSGDSFDVNKFNQQMNCIQKDLQFLYELLYELTVKEYNDIISYSETHVRELESISNQYSLRCDMEVNSSYLGNTIYFQTSGYNAIEKDNQTIIDLGKIKTRIGTKISWLLDANNVIPENCIMGIKIGESIKYIGPHNYIGDTFDVPGSITKNEYKLKIQNDQIVNSNYKIEIDKLIPNKNNSYYIYGGLDCVQSISQEEISILKKDINNSFYTENGSEFKFYIKNDKDTKIAFSNKPILFNDINKDEEVKIILDEYSGFSIDTSGKIYAEKDKGIIIDDKLYTTSSIKSKDLIIEEHEQGEEVIIECFIILINNDKDTININSIAIKELSL